VGGRGGGGLLTRALPRAFFDRPVLDVARDLLGRDVAHGGVVLRLTEVEAYRGADDAGSHAFRGPTKRNAVMFGPPGFVYVYFTYGMHWCMNLVCQREGEAAAVLLRAGRVVSGAEVARERRPKSTERDLARGPARLCQVLGIDGTLNGADLAHGPLRVLAGEPVPDALVMTGPRVGVTADAQRPWRFLVSGDPTVSVYRPAVKRVRRVRPTA
jgi:DNA-3-methyladenine glycosylase